MNNLYSEITQRNFGVYLREEQEKIKNSKIAIVGVGCDGGMDAYILARMGVGNLRLIDFDTNELSNMNRQPMATYSSRGLPKVYAAKSIIQDLNPTLEIESINAKLTEDNAEELLKGCDVALQGMDSMVGRIIFHRAAKKLGIPSITMTGQPPFRSFVSTIMPDGLTYEELFGIDFMIGKIFKDNPELEENVKNLKYERAEHSAKLSGQKDWLEKYKQGNAGWGITPERAYLTSVYQCHEALAILTGRNPKAIATKAYISDLNSLEEFGYPESLVAILEPLNGKNWDYRMF